jgi:signal peptidase I
MGPDVHDRPIGPAPPATRHPAADLFEAACVAVVFALFVRTFLVQAFEVPSASMERTLLVGDRVLVNKFVFAPRVPGPLVRLLPYRSIRRGDIFVFKYPEDPERDFIKRVAALPGDTVAILDKVLLVNGRRQDEPAVYHSDDFVRADDPLLPEAYRRRDQLPETRVPAGFFFALGDNRDASQDSRFWGPVPAENVKGRPLVVYWSLPPESERRRPLPRRLLALLTETRWNRTFLAVR